MTPTPYLNARIAAIDLPDPAIITAVTAAKSGDDAADAVANAAAYAAANADADAAEAAQNRMIAELGNPFRKESVK